MKPYTIQVANSTHFSLAESISKEMEESAKARGTGIAKRTPEYLIKKMEEGKAIIATDNETGDFVGFCYIETWGHGKFVANSGLIVKPDYRQFGVAKEVKKKAFNLSRERYPDAKLIGITTSLAVMKINSDLGYEPTTFSELPVDEEFWKGCQTCVNFDILSRTQGKICLCTGMMYDPEEIAKENSKKELKSEEPKEEKEKWLIQTNAKVLEKLNNFKQKLLKPRGKGKN